MRSARTWLFTIIIVSAAGVPPALAVSLAGRFGIFGDVGYGGFAMGDVNREIDVANQGINAAGYSSVDHINGGLTVTGGLTYGVLESLQVGAEAGYLSAQTAYSSSSNSYGSPYGSPSPGPSGPAPTYNLYVPALETGVLVRYLFPVADAFSLTGTLGLDEVFLSGYTKTDSGTTNFTGHGFGGKLMVGGEGFLGDHFSLFGDLGYRMEKVNEVKDSDGRVLKQSGDPGNNLTVDYSGVILQGGLRFYF
jgi:hypothetical protein